MSNGKDRLMTGHSTMRDYLKTRADHFGLGMFCTFLGATLVLLLAGLAEGTQMLIVAASATAAVTAASWAMYVQSSNVQERRSKFYLESFTEGAEEAHRLLEDGNNDRIKWIAAARILGRCEKLVPLITDADHRRIMEIKQDEYRFRFGTILQVRDRAGTAALFYGVHEKTAFHLDGQWDLALAAARSTDPGYGGSRPRQLTETSIHVIWRFARFPDNYDDPLRERFTVEQKARLELLNPELFAYLDFEDNNMSIGGEVHRLKEPRKRVTDAQVASGESEERPA